MQETVLKHRKSRRRRDKKRSKKPPLSQLPCCESPVRSTEAKVRLGEEFVLPSRKTGSSFQYMKAIWHSLRQTYDCLNNLSIPAWYTGVVGVPHWYLRQPSYAKNMDEQRRNLALLARMNYVLDFMVPQNHNRLFRRYVDSHGPIYDGSYRPIMGDRIPHAGYAARSIYDLERATRGTVRAFVQLLPYCRVAHQNCGPCLCKARHTSLERRNT
jgi:hypothetical protein